ncbi:MAG: PEP-CTERM sorting domain-containing protein [Gemmataceae bacterium]
MRPLAVVALLCSVHCYLPSASAALVLAPTRSSITNSQTVNWNQLGPAGTSVPQPFQITGSGGYTFTVYKNNSPTNYIRADEGNGFNGDFLINEPLLYSTSLTAFDFLFPTPVKAVGAQLQLSTPNSQPANWQPFIRVITVGGTTTDFTLPTDTNNHAHDGSTPFVGVISTSADIIEVLFDSFTGGNTAINFVTIAVPEPSSYVLALGAASFGFLRTRSRFRRRD